jgi:Cu/Ag efflux protein CusF
MKKLTILLGLVMAAALTMAEQGTHNPGTSVQNPGSSTQDKSKKEAKVMAEVVSVDRDAKTITLRSASSGAAGSMASQESLSLPVTGKAIGSLKDLASGDQVEVTCRAQASASSSMSDPSSTSPSASAGAAGSASASSGSSAMEPSSPASNTSKSPAAARDSAPAATGEVKLSQCTTVTAISKSKASSRTSSSSPGSLGSSLPPSAVSGVGATSTTGTGSMSGSSATGSASASAGKELTAEVVSADESSRTITIRAEATTPGMQASRTLSVDAKAAASLRNLQSGEKVKLVCRESAASGASATADLMSCSSVTSISKVSAVSPTSSIGSLFPEGSPAQDSPAARVPDPSSSTLGGSASPSTQSGSSTSSSTASSDVAGSASGSTSSADPSLGSSKQQTSQRTSDTSTGAKAGAKVEALVVSTDAGANTITIRSVPAPAGGTSPSAPAGESEKITLPVEGKAVASLKSIKAGDAVSIECRQQASSMGSTSMGTGSTAAPAGSGWSTVATGQCAAVTSIAKAKARTSGSSESDSSKAKTRTDESSSKQDQPKDQEKDQQQPKSY